jgi:hypothetical protein
MTYFIEGNINFYDELYKSLDIEEEEEKELETNNKCLITGELLTENCIKLDCTHTFNYDAIFNDIYNHKRLYNNMEKKSLKSDEIRCPYCRNIQQKLLPWIEGTKKIHGVNFYDEKQEFINNKYVYNSGICCYKYHSDQNIIVDVSGQNVIVDASGQHIIQKKCYNTYGKTLVFDNMFYCLPHHDVMYKVNLDINKINKKKELDEKKLKIKELKKELSIANKKLKVKVNVKDIKVTTLCSQILKSGKNKGLPCCNKTINNELCKRHNI